MRVGHPGGAVAEYLNNSGKATPNDRHRHTEQADRNGPQGANGQGFLTAFGQRDSHAVTLADGRQNHSPKAGTPYSQITWLEILHRALHPASVDKGKAQFFIPSTYTGHDGRAHEVQRENGHFTCLPIDIDAGSPTLEHVLSATRAVIGNAEFLVYSSASASVPQSRGYAGPPLYKWRILIPLCEGIAGADYHDTQAALFALLSEQGITCDTALDRTAQPVFLPNIPPQKRDENGNPLFYRTHHQSGPRTVLDKRHTITRRRAEIKAKNEAEAEAARQKAEQRQAERLAYVKATGDDFEPIEHFNESHGVASLLARYGFEKHRRTNDWKSPLSTSGSYGTKDFGTYWVAVSSWAANHGVGRPTRTGNQSGDAFDLYAYFEHGGDKSAAVSAYVREVRPDPPPRPPKPPHHPAPKDPRENALKGHRDTVSDTIRHAVKITRAAKAVARGYERYDEENPATTDEEKATAKRLIRSQVQERFNLDYAPVSTVTAKATPPRVMLSGAQGVGKTTRAEIELTKAYGVTTLALMPDHGKAEEFALSYEARREAGSPPVLVMRGRDQIDRAKADGRKMCLVPEAARALAKRGLSPKQILCTGCPLREQCGYVEQEVEAARLAHSGQGVVLVAPHEYAFLTLPNNIKPDLVLFDEAPRNLAVEHVSMSFDALSEPLKYEPKKVPLGKVLSAAGRVDAEQGALLIRWLRTTLRNAFQDNPAAPLATLRAEGVTPELVRKVIAALGDFMDQEIRAKVSEATPFFTFSKQDARALERSWVKMIEDHQHKNITAFKRICETLLLELGTTRDTANALTYSQNINAGTKGKDTAKGIVAHILKRPTFSETTPFLHMDGTGNRKLAEAIFGPLEHAQHRVDRLANITQVIGRTFSNVSITGEGFTSTKAKEAEQLRREIIAYCHAKPEAVVIACKTVIEVLQSAGLKNETAHFCALRGRNTWERYQAAVIIGRAEPSAGTVEPDARAFTATQEATFQSIRQADGNFPRYPREPRTIRTRQGPPVAIDVNVHPDPWANAVLEQMRDAEVIQAVDRLRLAFEDQGKRVFLLSPVVLDLTVDAVETWIDAKKGGSRLSQVIDRAGLIPLNKREACRYFPEIWTHERSAERDVKPVAERVETLKSLMAQNPNNILYLENAPLSETLLIEYTSTPKEGGRARARQALVWAASADEARTKVEALTGPLKAFALVDGWKEAVEAADLQAERAAIQEIENAPEPPEAPAEVPRGVVIALTRDVSQEASEAPPARAVGPPG